MKQQEQLARQQQQMMAQQQQQAQEMLQRQLAAQQEQMRKQQEAQMKAMQDAQQRMMSAPTAMPMQVSQLYSHNHVYISLNWLIELYTQKFCKAVQRNSNMVKCLWAVIGST